MAKWTWAALAALAVSMLATPAEAQRRKRTEDRRGDFKLFLRGGVGDFTGELADLTEAGPAWGVTFNIQPLNVIGWELTYNGSRNVIDADLVEDGPFVIRNGATGLLKLGLPFVERVKPFVGAGFGFSWANLTGDAGGRFRDDLMEEIPLAAGLEFNTGAITTGIRGSYRILIDEGWADPALPGSPQGGYLDGELTFGARF